MMLHELFHATILAGIRLASVGGKLQLRPASAVTPAIRNAALEHKVELLKLLAVKTPPADASPDRLADAGPQPDADAERLAIQAEPPVATGEMLAFPFSWDAAEAVELIAKARAARDANATVGQLPLLDAIDAAWAHWDLPCLRNAVAEFTSAVEVETATLLPNEGSSDAGPVWSIPPGSKSAAMDNSCPGCHFCLTSPNDA